MGAAVEARTIPDVTRAWRRRSDAVLILQIFAVSVMVIPSDIVIKAIGAGGYPSGLIGMATFALWAAATTLGLHEPLRHRHPIRGVLWLLWVATLTSYVLMDRRTLTVTELVSADRWLMQVAVITGVALVSAECLRSVAEIRRVIRALCWGGAFCGVVASLQYWISIDVSPYLRSLPGFVLNSDNFGISARAALNRVAGTATHPIELGTVAGMMLPLAIWLALTDPGASRKKRWAPVVLVGIGIPTSVSRSAILSVTLSVLVFAILMPPRPRLRAIAAMPVAVVMVFMSAPGLIATLASFFTAGTGDSSIATRVDDYPMVEGYVREAPWFGRGGGTYLADNFIDILDNQYLKTAIELGLVGVVTLIAFFVVPVCSALYARRRTSDPELRLLSGALAGSALAAAVCSVTFDSFSFPMFSNVHALVLGLVGAVYRLALRGAWPAVITRRPIASAGAADMPLLTPNAPTAD